MQREAAGVPVSAQRALTPHTHEQALFPRSHTVRRSTMQLVAVSLAQGHLSALRMTAAILQRRYGTKPIVVVSQQGCLPPMMPWILHC